MNTTIQQVAGYRWPSGGEQAIAILRVPLERLAEKSGLTLEQWDEEGLGPARGVWCRLPSGRVVQLYELEYTPEDRGAVGPNVSADLGDISRIGPEKLVDEVLQAFALSRADVSWSQDQRIRAIG